MSEGINFSQTSLTLPLSKDTWQLKIRSLLRFLGPAFIVSVAYIDPPDTVRGIVRKGSTNL